VLTLPADALMKNLQIPFAASPSYLFCLRYWLERLTSRSITGLLRVAGDAPTDGKSLLNWRRSVFVIDQLALAAPHQFRVEMGPLPRWEWPIAPLLNVATQDRSSAPSQHHKKEQVLERSLTDSEEARASFGATVGPIGPFLRQLPLGMFSGEKSKKNRWTPGGASQIDLWTTSMGGETIHLFELKAEGNSSAGMLPQVVYYARLLHYVRVGIGDGRTIAGAHPSLGAIRAAQRIRMWMVGPVVHPLLLFRGNSPLEWLNAAFASQDLEFGILPLELKPGGQWSRWCWDRQWPDPSIVALRCAAPPITA
jgi:hypothetical protein